MSDFDLIPEDYRYWQWQKRCMKRVAIFLLACLMSVLALSASLNTSSSRQNAANIDLQRQIAMVKIQQDQMSSLLEREKFLQMHWKLLEGLRGGVRADSTLKIVDESLRGEDVWFLNWEFQRLGQKVVRTGAASGNSDQVDFIDHLAGDQPQSWKIDTQVSITGQARDHSAFSEFVQRLTLSSEVTDVKIARTSLTTINDADIVEFNIQLLINNNVVAKSG